MSPIKPWKQAKAEFHKAYIIKLLTHYGHNVSYAAKAAGVQRKSLYRHMAEYGIPIQNPHLSVIIERAIRERRPR